MGRGVCNKRLLWQHYGDNKPSIVSTIDVDITGFGGNGALENLIRVEAILVR